jgi:hypothetical protein
VSCLAPRQTHFRVQLDVAIRSNITPNILMESMPNAILFGMPDTSQIRSKVLRCPTCGNSDLFYQVQEHAENLVDGNLNHLHLLFDETAFYECYECHTQIAPPEYS